MAKLIQYHPNLYIENDFTMHEVTFSKTAIDNNIINIPSPEQIKRARSLAGNVLQPIRNYFNKPVTINSWFRCEPLEKIITKTSFQKWCIRQNVSQREGWPLYFERKSHPLGGSADIEIVGVHNYDLYEFIKKNLRYDQLIAEFMDKDKPNKGWVHVSYVPGNRNHDFKIG